jgi:hypothetical protein
MWTAQNMGKYWSVRNNCSWFIYIHCYTNMLWVLMIMQASGGIPRRREHISIWRSPKNMDRKRCYSSGRDLPLYWPFCTTKCIAIIWSYYCVDAHWELVITVIDISLLSEYLSFYLAVCVLMMCCFWNGCGVFETSRKYRDAWDG